MNILFVNLLTIPYDHLKKIILDEGTLNQELVMPLGILYLSSSLKEKSNNANISLLDFTLSFKNRRRIKSIDDFIRVTIEQQIRDKPDVIAFSLMFSSSHMFFRNSLKILRETYPESIFVVGGIHATNAAHYILKNEDIDYILLGESETAFSEFIDHLNHRSDAVSKIKGCYAKGEALQGTALAHAEAVKNIDELPFPDWELLNMEEYVSKGGWRRNIGETINSRSATLMTTRGCPHHCTYCSAHTVHGRKVKYRSIENVLKEMLALYINSV